MRPLRLELKGFTAFRDDQVLDFTDLEVFAIAGPTGSGKSSLLDAMTYALYGRVERVGDRVSQLISQGQPRMAVTLEYEVGRERYRVTRSTSSKGATKILLERRDPCGEWGQAGEGADRVREAEPLIARTIGLTYDGFTRSVLLPQGRFAEFLVGDPKKRREILTELLDLTLFRRMAERAGAIAKEAAFRAQALSDMLAREYADATPHALKEAKTSARAAVLRERRLSEAADHVLAILGRWEEAKRSAEELRACAGEASEAARRAVQAAGELDGLAGRLAGALEALERCSAASEAAQLALAETRAALDQAHATGGSPSDLAAAQVRAHALAKDEHARDAKVLQQERSSNDQAALDEALEAAGADLAGAREGLAVREAAWEAAENALEEARHADLVATVSAGLKAGDPCPVCGLPLKKAPGKTAAGALDGATKALSLARKGVEEARTGLTQAERRADAARREREANAVEQARLQAEVRELDLAIESHRTALQTLLGEPLPAEPVAAVEDRMAELQRLDRADREAAKELAEATQSLLKAEQECDRAQAQIDRLADRLAADHRPLLDRAARAAGPGLLAPDLPSPPAGTQPEKLGRFAQALAAALAAFADRLAQEVQQRASAEERLLSQATAEVEGLVEPSKTLEQLARAVDHACRAATADVATSSKAVDDLTRRVESKKELEGEAQELGGRSHTFRQLALELRADRLIAFLQAEALQLLAGAGSERLASLSDGRYRLVCRDDEFLVVDTWNGDEERSVRTLSGGETFLASLALALALSEQVRSLSVTDRSRLDSLFLDEGFGTLDPEVLRTVVDAIEQLGGDGRLVGVITHVRDLAEQFPRLEVRKSQRGSRVEFVP
jgi:exonuclease SbcC